MASCNDTVYIKADRNIEVTKPEVTLGDVLKIECANSSVTSRIKTLKLLKFHNTDKKNQNRTAVSILKVIECIHEVYPNVDIQNVGEEDFIIKCHHRKCSAAKSNYDNGQRLYPMDKLPRRLLFFQRNNEILFSYILLLFRSIST